MKIKHYFYLFENISERLDDTYPLRITTKSGKEYSTTVGHLKEFNATNVDLVVIFCPQIPTEKSYTVAIGVEDIESITEL